MTRIPMTRLPWLIRTRVLGSEEFLPTTQEHKYLGYFWMFFILYHENVCCV